MEGMIVEKTITQILHLLTTNPDLQKSLLEHGTMTIQHLGISIPLHATELFLNGLKQLSDAHWIGGLGLSANPSHCCRPTEVETYVETCTHFMT
jgi:hypothetical protein